jgi:RsiW-degrading membrane proteinase PrsW (M82 family)
MMIVGVVEELGKFLAVYLYVYRKSEFNEVMDGIIYSAAASLGFASLENLFYILEFGPGVIVGRAILSTLGHVLFASFWGYALGLKKITGKNTIFTGLILSMAAHGIYNALLTTELVLSAVLVIVFMIILYRSMSDKIKKSLTMSPFATAEDSRTGAVCPQCGNILPEHSTYCPNCGRKV